jgi:hypothetical protein
MRVAPLLVGISLLAQVGCQESSAETFEYVRWLSPENLTLSEEQAGSRPAGLVVSGHVRYETKFCDSSSDYYCFITSDFAFSVPREGPIPSFWIVEGLRFELREAGGQVAVAGRVFRDVMLIACPAGVVFPDRRHMMLYSFEDGLIAIAREDLGFTYWLSGEKGFAARR